MGDRMTEADWRLFTTLIRFDPVYHLHFKCNKRRLVDYPNLWAFTRELYQWPGVAATVNMNHIVRHYHFSHDSINPHRIIPVNPRTGLLGTTRAQSATSRVMFDHRRQILWRRSALHIGTGIGTVGKD